MPTVITTLNIRHKSNASVINFIKQRHNSTNNTNQWVITSTTSIISATTISTVRRWWSMTAGNCGCRNISPGINKTISISNIITWRRYPVALSSPPRHCLGSQCNLVVQLHGDGQKSVTRSQCTTVYVARMLSACVARIRQHLGRTRGHSLCITGDGLVLQELTGSS